MKFWFLKRSGKIIGDQFYDPNHIKPGLNIGEYLKNSTMELRGWKEWPKNYLWVPSSGEFEKIISQTVPSKRF